MGKMDGEGRPWEMGARVVWKSAIGSKPPWQAELHLQNGRDFVDTIIEIDCVEVVEAEKPEGNVRKTILLSSKDRQCKKSNVVVH